MYKINWLDKQDFTKFKANLLVIDTETDGLHIIKNKAFCVSIALVNTDDLTGTAKTFKNKEEIIMILKHHLPKVSKIIFYNTKFDLHMLYNIGIDLVGNKKVTDALFYARIGLPAIPSTQGGPVLQLKVLAKKFIDPNADVYQKRIKEEKRKLVLKRTSMIKKLGYKIGDIEEFLKDKTNDINELPSDVRSLLKDKNLDPSNYENIPYEVIEEYAKYDAIFTAELFLLFEPIVIERNQMQIIDRENNLTPVLWGMERLGLSLDIKYLIESKEKVKTYLLSRRKDLIKLTGTKIKIGQHKKIKQFFLSEFGISLNSTNNDALKSINVPEKAVEIANIIIELRTLEKWYSTYINRWCSDIDLGKMFTNYNQMNAVSGRLSSDFQQFPNESIKTHNGEELFNPRNLVITSKGYHKLLFVDYNAEELRFQALYTYLIKKPDLNLCRAFIPFDCVREDNHKIEYDIRKDITTFKNHTWVLKENKSIKWTPTDLHTKTCLTAFPELTPDHPEFSHFRKIAKSSNFCINYGGNKETLELQFGYSKELAEKLYTAYYKAYPGITEYKAYVRSILHYQNYITNLFGRRYYDTNSHKAANYLVQGSAADFMKIKLIELHTLLKPYKSRLIITIHDEIGFEIHKDEEHIQSEIIRIMEDFESPIPFPTEAKHSFDCWGELEHYENISD